LKSWKKHYGLSTFRLRNSYSHCLSKEFSVIGIYTYHSSRPPSDGQGTFWAPTPRNQHKFQFCCLMSWKSQRNRTPIPSPDEMVLKPGSIKWTQSTIKCGDWTPVTDKRHWCQRVNHRDTTSPLTRSRADNATGIIQNETIIPCGHTG
jgi:hypothetical protein